MSQRRLVQKPIQTDSKEDEASQVICKIGESEWKTDLIETQDGTVVEMRNIDTFDCFKTTNPIPGKTLMTGEIIAAFVNDDGYYYKAKIEGEAIIVTIKKDQKFRSLQESFTLAKVKTDDMQLLKQRMERAELKIKTQEKEIAFLREYVERKIKEEEEEEEEEEKAAKKLSDDLGLEIKHINALKGWIGFNPQTTTLLYSSAKDGSACSTFHSKCDGKGATLTIVELTNGHIFGGYASVSWNSNGSYMADANAFLFSLTDGKNREPVKMSQYQNPQYALYGVSGYGPTFGGGHDLYINLDSPSSSSSNLGRTYLPPNSYSAGSQQAKAFFAGSPNGWSFKNVRVYRV